MYGPPHHFGVINHLLQRDRQGIGVSLYDHPQGVAHQDAFDFCGVQQLRQREIVGRQHGDFLAGGLHGRKLRDGDRLTVGIHDAYHCNGRRPIVEYAGRGRHFLPLRRRPFRLQAGGFFSTLIARFSSEASSCRSSIAALCCCGLAATAAAEPADFPYKAFITADNVYVRSGPGENYYPTDKLKAGPEVEVYRHDPGEMVCHPSAQRQLHLGGQPTVGTRPPRAGHGGRRARACPGGQPHERHPRRDPGPPARGEVVEVLEVKHTGPASETGANTWYRIAPPSGEFRWISAAFVDRQFQRDGLGKNALAAARPAESAAVRNRTAGWPARRPA